MTMNEVRYKAKGLGLTLPVGMTKLDAIRSVQRAEGNTDCFGRGLYNTCGQADCCFRADCIKIN